MSNRGNVVIASRLDDEVDRQIRWQVVVRCAAARVGYRYGIATSCSNRYGVAASCSNRDRIIAACINRNRHGIAAGSVHGYRHCIIASVINPNRYGITTPCIDRDRIIAACGNRNRWNTRGAVGGLGSRVGNGRADVAAVR